MTTISQPFAKPTISNPTIHQWLTRNVNDDPTNIHLITHKHICVQQIFTYTVKPR